MSSATPLPSTAANHGGNSARFWLGNALLALAWLAGMALLSYAVAVPTYRWWLFAIVTVPLGARLVHSIVRGLRLHRRRRPVSDAVAILDGVLAGGDERQQYLNVWANAFAGTVGVAVLGTCSLVLALAAAAADVTIATVEDWMMLGFAITYALSLTQIISIYGRGIMLRRYNPLLASFEVDADGESVVSFTLPPWDDRAHSRWAKRRAAVREVLFMLRSGVGRVSSEDVATLAGQVRGARLADPV